MAKQLIYVKMCEKARFLRGKFSCLLFKSTIGSVGSLTRYWQPHGIHVWTPVYLRIRQSNLKHTFRSNLCSPQKIQTEQAVNTE